MIHWEYENINMIDILALTTLFSTSLAAGVAQASHQSPWLGLITISTWVAGRKQGAWVAPAQISYLVGAITALCFAITLVVFGQFLVSSHFAAQIAISLHIAIIGFLIISPKTTALSYVPVKQFVKNAQKKPGLRRALMLGFFLQLIGAPILMATILTVVTKAPLDIIGSSLLLYGAITLLPLLIIGVILARKSPAFITYRLRQSQPFLRMVTVLAHVICIVTLTETLR